MAGPTVAATATTAAANYLIKQVAESAGAHAQLYAINAPYNRTIRETTAVVSRVMGDNPVTTGIATGLGAMRGANLAMDPLNLEAARYIGSAVSTGVNRFGTAFTRPEGIQTTQAVTGALLAVGGIAAADIVPSAVASLPLYLNVARMAYVLMTRQQGSSSTPTCEQDSSKLSQAEKEVYLKKVAEVMSLLQDLNPEEVAEVQKMIADLESEMDGTDRSKMDQAVDLVQELVVNAGISALSGGLGNLAKINVINGAYNSTVAAAGALGRGAFSFMGNNTVGTAVQSGADFTARNFSRAFIAPRVATSARVMEAGARAATMTSRGVSTVLQAADGYVGHRAAQSQPRERTWLETAGTVAACTAGGAAVLFLNPGAFVSAAGGMAFSRGVQYYMNRGTPQPSEVAKLPVAASAIPEFAQGKTTGIDDVKVSAAFIRLIQLSPEEKTVLSETAALPPEKVVLSATAPGPKKILGPAPKIVITAPSA